MPTSDAPHTPTDAQRTNILDGARRAFARKGRAATMADVAAAAGISQGLAYRYFSGKEAIYRELIASAVEQAGPAVGPPEPDSSATPWERLTWMLTQIVSYRRDHLEVFQLLDLVMRAESAPDDFADMLRQRGEHFIGELRRLIVAGQAAGEVAPDDPDQLVVAITASLDGIVRFGFQHPEQFPRLCPDAAILLRMLKP